MWPTLHLEAPLYFRRNLCCSFWLLCYSSGSLQTSLKDARFHSNRVGHWVPGTTSERDSEKVGGTGEKRVSWEKKKAVETCMLSYWVTISDLQSAETLCVSHAKHKAAVSLCSLIFLPALLQTRMHAYLQYNMLDMPLFLFTIIIYFNTLSFQFWNKMRSKIQ